MSSSSDEISRTVVPEIEKLLHRDGYLRMHEFEIKRRYYEFNKILTAIEKAEGMGRLTTALSIDLSVNTPFPMRISRSGRLCSLVPSLRYSHSA